MVSHDVIVVGAGPGGLSAAITAARRGLRVLLIEQKPIERAGRDWCDFVDAGVFAEAGLPLPPPETWRAVTSPTYASPDLTTFLQPRRSAVLPFLYVDRKRLHAWMVAQLPAGVTVADRRTVEGPLLDGSRVVGVIVKDGAGREERSAAWVIDAGGIAAPIGSQVPYTDGFSPDGLARDDVFVARKEIHASQRSPVMGASDDLMVPRWHGGFAWIVTHGQGEIDLGVAHPEGDASAMRHALVELRRRAGVTGAPARVGGGRLPARRCRTRLAGDGWAAVGDAACQVNPASGGGISPAILAGALAARAVADACGSIDGKQGVWRYPVDFVQRQGADFAGLDALRRTFQSLGARHVGVAMEAGLLTYTDFLTPMLKQHLPRPRLSDVRRLWSGRGHARLLARILSGFATAHALEAAYRAVPEEPHATAIAKWERRIRQVSTALRRQNAAS